MKLCQGPKCHTYETVDRKRGPKGNKRNETRRASSFNYLGGNACTMNCERDWFASYGARAIEHFGRITKPNVLHPENAWRMRYDWRSREDGGCQHYVYNYLTNESRNITEEQYDNDNVITSDGRLNI